MIWTAVIVAVAYQVFVLIPAVIIHLLVPGLPIILLAGLSNLAAGFALYGLLRLRGVAWEVVDLGDVNTLSLGLALGGAAVSLALTAILSGMLAAVFGPDGLSVSESFMDQIHSGSRGEILFTIVLVAPLVEEFIYRGLLLGVLLARGWAPTFAIGLSALIFALQHIQYGWIGIAMVMVYGLVLGLLRVATGGLFAPILAHLSINLVSVLFW